MDLREYLFRNNITKTAFAKKIGYSRSYLNQIILKKLKPGIHLAKLIEIETGGQVAVEEILGKKHTTDVEP